MLTKGRALDLEGVCMHLDIHLNYDSISCFLSQSHMSMLACLAFFPSNYFVIINSSDSAICTLRVFSLVFFTRFARIWTNDCARPWKGSLASKHRLSRQLQTLQHDLLQMCRLWLLMGENSGSAGPFREGKQTTW